jgi:hypothetical protein
LGDEAATDLGLLDKVDLVLEDENVLQLHNLNGRQMLCIEGGLTIN